MTSYDAVVIKDATGPDDFINHQHVLFIFISFLNDLIGFDIVFCGKNLGKSRSTFSWILNNQYQNVVTVHADVIPIELSLSKSVFNFQFPVDSGKRNNKFLYFYFPQ